jgi:hypothetical protein
MSETATTRKTGTRAVLAQYECDEGGRQLVGQRVNGSVHISDVPVGGEGRVHLVEKQSTSPAWLMTPPTITSSGLPTPTHGESSVDWSRDWSRSVQPKREPSESTTPQPRGPPANEELFVMGAGGFEPPTSRV